MTQKMVTKLNQQLNKLQNEIRPDQAWQARSRDILLMQIRQGAVEKEAHWFTFIETVWMQRFLFQATRPLALASIILVAVFGSSVLSIKAANQTKPGDALYIAKIISEKTQFALTFDNTKKAKLNLTFATNRATELKEIESDKANDAGHEEKIKELTTEIQAEMAEAQKRISKIVPIASVKINEETKSATEDAKKTATPSTNQKAVKIESAVVAKDDSGIDYFDPLQVALEKAKNFIENKDYNAAASQLQTLNEAIDQPEKLDIKKASTSDIKVETLQKEGATSTLTK